MATASTTQGPDAEIAAALVRMQLLRAGDAAPMQALAGGVSSDIWRVELPGRTICVKRALPRLKVEAEWIVPVDRSRHEWDWYRLVDARLPGACPHPIARDETSNLFAMDFLPAATHPLWKTQLLAGEVDVAVARAVGTALGRIHATTAGDAAIERAFATDALFHALRLEPYLEAAARAHPDRAQAILAIEATTASTRRVLVHGDVSPKNILVGPRGPVFLDAECAWYGEPAFDLAFCLNHLLLKTLARPDRRHVLAASFVALAETYAAEVDWEPGEDVLARTARLLPALFLARVDGKSPVEYLHDERDRERVRTAARRWLAAPGTTPGALLDDWLAR
ncbi:MAG: phosphotransferase [Burkholderiales bacterium]|nr:phosphotransferase [Burkholderiales bacterium]